MQTVNGGAPAVVKAMSSMTSFADEVGTRKKSISGDTAGLIRATCQPLGLMALPDVVATRTKALSGDRVIRAYPFGNMFGPPVTGRGRSVTVFVGRFTSPTCGTITRETPPIVSEMV